jgi:hypothetical protein
MVDCGQIETQQPPPVETGKTSQSLVKILRGEEHYAKLPPELVIEDKLLAGIEELRPHGTDNLVENGGVLIQAADNIITVIQGGKSGETFSLNAPSITETNISDYLDGQYVLFRDDKPLKDMIIVDWQVLNKNKAYFKDLMDKGMKVIIGSSLGTIHSHPSGNLPSPTDTISTLYETEDKNSEVIVTSDWTYFLVPSLETPDLFLTDPHRNLLVPLNKGDKDVELEQKNGKYLPGEGPINTYRLSVIKNLCQENNVGFFCLKKGDKIARKVF